MIWKGETDVSAFENQSDKGQIYWTASFNFGEMRIFLYI